MKTPTRTLAILAGLSILAIAATAHANLVLNPGFDLDTPSRGTAPVDWTFTPAISGSDFFVGSGPTFGPYSAPNSANFGSVGDYDDTLSQVISTTPGVNYTISFELAHNSTNDENDFSATFGNVTGYSIVDGSYFGYSLVSFTAVATSSSTTLSFSGREVPDWYDLDNVSVTGGVPEPATWAMLLIGLAGIGATMRAHRRADLPSLSLRC